MGEEDSQTYSRLTRRVQSCPEGSHTLVRGGGRGGRGGEGEAVGWENSSRTKHGAVQAEQVVWDHPCEESDNSP